MSSRHGRVACRVTKRQLQVLQLIAEGKSTKDIGARLGLSASPPQSMVSAGSPRHPESTSICQVAGVAWSIDAPPATIAAASRRPSMAVSRLAISTRAPTISGETSRIYATTNAQADAENHQTRRRLPVARTMPTLIHRIATMNGLFSSCGFWK